MIELLAEKYRVFFEGLPEPVFYGHFYPMGDKAGAYQEALWDEFDFGRGLKADRDPDRAHWSRFADKYERELRGLLNAVMDGSGGENRAVVVIPSSTKGEVNRLTELVRDILASNPGAFDDLTRHVTRIRTKEKAHAGGSRSYQDGLGSIGVARECRLARYDVIVVLDDVLTSGTSFRAMDARLRAAGFDGELVNYAFCRTVPSDGAVNRMEHESAWPNAAASRHQRAKEAASRPIEALVLDLDQTLLDDPVRDVEFEAAMRSPGPRGPVPYRPYDGVRQLSDLCIPYAIVSNRPEGQLENLICEQPLADALYPHPDESADPEHRSVAGLRAEAYSGSAWGSPAAGALPRNVFPAPESMSGEYRVRHYKPSARGVLEAAGYLRRELLGNRPDARIVGLGNTRDDIAAYAAAGIEGALALWGVPEGIRQHARASWGADYAFESLDEFTAWVKSGTGYAEMARAAEESAPDKALEYYELAVKADDDVYASAFGLARMLHDADPARAAGFYGMSLAAGDDYASANNLALLVQESDPERAIALFEQAIAAGNEEHATRNLAKLIADAEPKRAVALLERAHAAGGGEHLAQDLEPLVRAGCGEAADLYERLIVSADPRRAYDLALLVEPNDPEKAESLLERAIDAGDELDATYELGRVLMREDPERAAGLFERAIAAGSERLATNALGCVVSQENPEGAASLFERAIAAGDSYYAPVNLASLVADEDPARALDLLEQAAGAGRADLSGALKPLVERRVPGAAELYEKAVVAADGKLANDLGQLVEPFDREAARRLFRHAIESGDERYATGNLATLLVEEDPEEAKSLFERAIAAGDEDLACNNLAIMIAGEDPKRAANLLERAYAAGDARWAGCNLGHLKLASDPGRAAGLYENACELGETEAALGLAYLVRESDPERSTVLLGRAKRTGDRAKSVRQFLELAGCADRPAAMDAARFLIGSGFDEARESLVPIAFWGARPSEDTVLLGESPHDGSPLEWLIVGQDDEDVLLLSKRAVVSIPLGDGQGNARWESSAIRNWLESEFLPNWIGADRAGWLVPHAATGDLAFLLSAGELDTLPPDTKELLECRDLATKLPADWWLRPESETTMSAPYVTAQGNRSWSIASLKHGVRPAIRVRLNACCVD